MKTAMQELIEELENKIKHIESNEDVYFNYGIRKSIQIALVQFIEKEKEQICNAYTDGLEGPYIGAEQYYNQTYNDATK